MEALGEVYHKPRRNSRGQYRQNNRCYGTRGPQLFVKPQSYSAESLKTRPNLEFLASRKFRSRRKEGPYFRTSYARTSATRVCDMRSNV